VSPESVVRWDLFTDVNWPPEADGTLVGSTHPYTTFPIGTLVTLVFEDSRREGVIVGIEASGLYRVAPTGPWTYPASRSSTE